jgi:molybdate transport system permease protein
MYFLDIEDISALLITIQLASITTIFLLLIGIPTAWWLAQSKSKLKYPIQTIITLPLVLPPTVLGFYLLIFLNAQGVLSPFYQFFDIPAFAFSFSGLVIGSMIYSLPFVVQPLYVAFSSISPLHLELASSLGAKPLDRFFSLILPLAKNGIITAIVLGFAHTIGEFGVVLMIGGNIPDETRVLSIAIYDHVESLEYAKAHWLSAILLVFSLITLMVVFIINPMKTTSKEQHK